MIITLGSMAEVETGALGRAMLVLAPLVLAAALSGDANWLLAAIVTVSAYIAMERSGLAPLGVVLHGLAIVAGFMALLAAQAIPLLFIIGCAALASTSVLLTARGANLQSLGIFTFIPALYLACEAAEAAAPHQLVQHGTAFLPFVMVALLPVLLLSAFDHICACGPGVNRLHHFRRILRWSELGVRSFYGEAMIAAALAVAVAASAVEWWHIEHGQWVIWSAASVVTGDAASGNKKLRDRITGAIVGVPAGIGVGWLLPQGAQAYVGIACGVATILAVLSLVALRPYVVAFGLRCGCAGFGLLLASHSTAIAAERTANVVLGGIIGIAFVLIIRAVAGAFQPARNHHDIIHTSPHS
jgi:hypothetical protein